MFYFLETVIKRTKLSWAKSTSSSFAAEEKNLLNISL